MRMVVIIQIYLFLTMPHNLSKTIFYDTADADNLPVYAEKYGYDGVIIKKC